MMINVNEQVKDLVCGMKVNLDTAPAQTDYNGKTYYFCAQICKVLFDNDPEKYLYVSDSRLDAHNHR